MRPRRIASWYASSRYSVPVGYHMWDESAGGAAGLPVGFGGRVSRMTLCRVAFVLMCFAPQLRYLMPQAGLATLLAGVMLAYASLPPYRLSRTSMFFGAYFIAFGMFGLAVQLLGDVPPGMPPARPLFFYALTTLALVLTGLAIVRRHGGNEFVLGVLCALLVVEVAIVGLQFAHMSYGVGLALTAEDAIRDHLIEGSYGNPNNVALVLAMLLMVLVVSGYVRMSSMFGAALVVATLAAIFVTLSRTALVFLVVFLAAAMLLPKMQRLSIAAAARAVRRLLPVLAVLGATLLVLQRWGVMANLEELATFERSLVRVATLSALDQDASVEFRMMVTLRLIEALDSLGFGTLSDRNYGEFFQHGDNWLATANPHSYVAEMAFLLGYPGLFMALAFLAVAIWRIIAVSGNRRFLAVLFGLSVLFFQMVPSSVFPLDIFFLLVIIVGSRGLQSAQRPAARRHSSPSLGVSAITLP